jgi:hypothetical protein
MLFYTFFTGFNDWKKGRIEKAKVRLTEDKVRLNEDKSRLRNLIIGDLLYQEKRKAHQKQVKRKEPGTIPGSRT